MANHISSIRRIRNSAAKRLRNRYQAKTTRNLIKTLRETTDKKAAEEMMPKVFSHIDRLAKKNIIHKNKAANQKGKLARLVNSL